MTRSAALSPSAVAAAQDVRVAVSRLRRRMREFIPVDGLTPSQTSVLSRLEKDGAATASALAEAERVRPQSMAVTVAHLTDIGLVRRDPDPDDGRRQLLTLTAAGVRVVRGSRQARDDWLTSTLQQHCTEDERQTVIAAMAVLDRVVAL